MQDIDGLPEKVSKFNLCLSKMAVAVETNSNGKVFYCSEHFILFYRL